MPPEAVTQAATIARLEIQVEHLIEALADFKASAKEEREEARRASEAVITVLQKRLEAIEQQMQATQTVISEARGGWKTLAAALALAGAVGSGLTWLANHWKA